MFFILYVLAVVAAITSTDHQSSSHGSSSDLSTSSSSSSFTPTLTISYTTEDAHDIALPKLLLFKDEDSQIFYNAQIDVGGQPQQLRIDVIQPELWVLNGNEMYNCLYLDDIYYSASSANNSALVNDLATAVCGDGGLYTTAGDLLPSAGASVYTVSTPTPEATIAGIANGERYDLPYLNDILAVGEFGTDDVQVQYAQGEIELDNFTFVNVLNASVFYGGLGLSGGAQGTGFLPSLVQNEVILTPGYSLVFFNDSSETDAVAQLLPGLVNSKYYTGNFYVWDALEHNGPKYSGARAQLFDHLTLPIVALSGLGVESSETGAKASLLDVAEAVVFDTRSLYLYIPLALIVNLAIQTNAYYNNELERWIVECESLRDVNAIMNFEFGPLEVPVPLNNFIVDAWYGDGRLNFSDGSAACYLLFLPLDLQGFLSLGLNFLPAVYLAVENAAGKIAMANANTAIRINTDDYSTLANSTVVPSLSSVRNASLIAHMTSGHIPFATSALKPNVTLIYSSALTDIGGDLIPARFSGITILLGEIFITGAAKSTGILPALATSTLSSTTKSSEGRALVHGLSNSKAVSFWTAWVVGIVMCCVFVV